MAIYTQKRICVSRHIVWRLGEELRKGRRGGRGVRSSGKEDLPYGMIATVEESCEMAGVIVFIYALLRYLADNYGEVRSLLGERSDDARSRPGGA